MYKLSAERRGRGLPEFRLHLWWASSEVSLLTFLFGDGWKLLFASVDAVTSSLGYVAAKLILTFHTLVFVEWCQ